MTIADMIASIRAKMAEKLAARQSHTDTIAGIRQRCADDDSRDPNADEAGQITTARAAVVGIDAELDQLQARVAELTAEQTADEAAQRLQAEVAPGATPPAGTTPGQVRVTSEPRTYTRESDPKGIAFLRDVAMSYVGNAMATSRLQDHMREEQHEREAAGQALIERAVGTGAFTGLVVPQYLTDEFAPAAKAGRPLADAMRHHDMPPQGMTVNIGRLTTGTATALQAAEGNAVQNTDSDDTLLTIPVQTNAGQQVVSRQAVERGAGVDDTLAEDLFRAYGTTLDSTLINQAATGLTNVATSIAYTDATPTAPELYPKLLQAPSQVETAMLDQDQGDTFAVMHSRRWYWLQSQLGTSWPLFGQPGVAAQQAGVNYGEKYGSGFRGLLPNGTPALVDANISTVLGAGTEDEIYFLAKNEAHLWEDPAAPMYIRAEQALAANLQILLVVYGYFAYTFMRRPHTQKINGTGLIAPTF